MKVKELSEVCKYSLIELHSGFDGRFIASSPKSIEKYANVEVLSIYPRIKVEKYSCDYAKAYLYVFIDEQGVKKVNEQTV